jgi:hypothetical protein
MGDDQLEAFLEMYGGYDYSSGNLFFPIPVPWSRDFHEDYNHEPYHHLYPAQHLREELNIEITFGDSAWLVDTSTVTVPEPLNFEVHFIEYQHGEQQEALHKSQILSSGWSMRGPHFEVIQSQAIVTATKTSIDLSALATQGSGKVFIIQKK